MRLYHRSNFLFLRSIIILFLSIVLFGCSAPVTIKGQITVSITADNREIQVDTGLGSSVQKVLDAAQISLGEIDRVEPPENTIVSDGARVKIIRVKEEYFTEQVIIPFEYQELFSEALLEGESRLSQPGENGLEEITYHRIFEDDLEVTNLLVKSVVLKDAVPEVVMIGSRSTFTSINIPGRIAYLSAGNAWVIENNTGNHRCVVSTGDLDGRIFSLSKNGDYLLFTRYSSEPNIINSLWVATLESNPARLFDLGEDNIVHFAEFDPDSNEVAYSTAEWREAAPGWQANNDLYEKSMSIDGLVGLPQMDISPTSGGVYGWWGMEYSWAPDQFRFLYARPDSIGIIDIRDGTQRPILNIAPYQTGGNWAWVPGTAWSPDGNEIYAVNHVSSENNDDDESQEFDLFSVPLTSGKPIELVHNVGMFAYPVPSPMDQKNNFISNTSEDSLDQNSFYVAYLQAIFPEQSETSGYRLFIIDRDGSNKKNLFPEEGELGINPQHVVWSPDSMGTAGNFTIALIYNANIWIIDVGSSVARQITGDESINRIDWR